MKKLFAMLLALLASLSNNTSFSVVQETPYNDNYYKITVDEPPDYRTYYNSSFSETSKTNCKTTTYSAQGKRVSGSAGYWFVNGYPKSLDDLNGSSFKSKNEEEVKVTDKVSEDNYTAYYQFVKGFDEGSYIIMPYSGTLESPSATTRCDTMTVYCTNPETNMKYKLVISNMRCWYCDIAREDALKSEDEEGNEIVCGTLYHTSDEKRGKKFAAGNVLGVATPSTVIQIFPINDKGSVEGRASIADFYSGKKEDDSKE